MFLSNYKNLYKSLRILVLLICIAVSAYQLYVCFAKLRNPPISTHYSFVFNESLQYPSVTICRNPSFKRELFRKYGFLNEEITYATTWKSFKYDQYTLKQFFNEVTYNLSEITSILALDRFQKNLKVSSTMTLTYGQCFTLSPKSRSTKWGNKYGYYFYLAPQEISIPSPVGFHIFIHEGTEVFSEKVLDEVLQEYMFIDMGDSIQVNLKVNIYNQLPIGNRNCSTSLQYSRSKCIESKANDVISRYSQCQTPWVTNEALPECESFEQVQAVVTNSTPSLYLQEILKNTECPKKCKTTLYLPLLQTIRGIDPSSWSLKIYYSSNLINQMGEVIGYDWNNLISDLGGSLGFLLGLSVFGSIGLIEQLVTVTMKSYLVKKVQEENGSNDCSERVIPNTQ